jgi:hypothetical protein
MERNYAANEKEVKWIRQRRLSGSRWGVMSGQLHAPATYTWGNSSQYLLNRWMCPTICVDVARNWKQTAQSYGPQLSHLPTFLVNGRVQNVWSHGNTKQLHTWIVLVLVLIPRPQETLQGDHWDQRDVTQSTAASSVLALFSKDRKSVV